MATPLQMPALSPTMTEGGVVAWRKKEGEAVRAGEVLVEIETDKAVMEVEASADGVLDRILVQAGEPPVAVGTPIAWLREAAGIAPSPAPPPPEVPAAPAAPLAASPSRPPRGPAAGPAARKAVTPVARKLAAELGVDTGRMTGSGPGGRVVKADVIRAAENGRLVAQAPATSAPLHLTIDCDVEELVQWIARLADEGIPLMLEAVVIAATARALIRRPRLNGTWENGAATVHRGPRIAIAVPGAAGMLTPVIAQAQDKGIEQLSREFGALMEAARSGTLEPRQCQGGTFTILSMGQRGIHQCSLPPVPPQACSLGMGAAERRPVARGHGLAVATVLSCTLSADPRMVDAESAANFLDDIRRSLERPLTMLL